MLKAVLVDFDGTLVDTSEANTAAYCEALKEFNFDVSPKVFFESAEGHSWKYFIPALTGISDLSEAERIALRKRELYPKQFHLTKVNHSLVTLLRAVRAEMQVALVTTASRTAVSSLLTFHHIDDLFDTIVTGDDVATSKPDPAPYHLAASRLGVKPAHCIIFEDSNAGIQSATSFGGSVYAVVNAFSKNSSEV